MAPISKETAGNVDASAVQPTQFGNLTVREGHDIAHAVKDALIASAAHRITDVTVHVELGHVVGHVEAARALRVLVGDRAVLVDALLELGGGGPDSLNALIRGDDISPFSWSVRAFVPGNPREARVAFAPDGRIFVAEKDGVIKIIKNASDVTAQVKLRLD